MSATKDSREHLIYGFRDTTGRLIYVGRTVDLETRETAHSHAAWWWPQVDRVEILATAPTRQEAIWIERQMVETQRPRWNQMHRLYHHQGWDLDDYLDVILSRLVAGGFRLDASVLRHCRALPRLIAAVNAQLGMDLSVDRPRELLTVARRGVQIPQKYMDLLVAAEQAAA